MDINKPFSIEELNATIEKLEPKIVYVNKKTYDIVMSQLDFEPTNLVLNNFIPDYQAIVVSEKKIEEMRNALLQPNLH